MDANALSSNVVTERQCSLPSLGHARAFECLQDGLSIVVADGDGDDGRLVAGLERVKAGGIGKFNGRCYAGGLWVARILEQILHRSALHAGIRAPGAVRISIALKVAIILGIGVDEHADRSALLGNVYLDAAKVGAVADEDNLAVQIDMLRCQLIEVFEAAIVGVDHFASYVS